MGGVYVHVQVFLTLVLVGGGHLHTPGGLTPVKDPPVLFGYVDIKACL
jgi:hypothetical protein